MSRYFYKSFVNQNNSLTIYSISEGKSKELIEHSKLTDLFILIGYINASQLLINYLKAKENLGGIDDLLAYPFLNLFYCTLEGLLKAILNKLLAHSSKCRFFTGILDLKKNEETLKHHNLKNLLHSIKCFFTSADSPHVFGEFEHIEELINEFEENGINSSSTRYHYDKKGANYSLFRSQINVKIYDLHEAMKKALDLTLNFIEGNHFEFCVTNYFTRGKFEELNFILNAYKKHKHLLRNMKIKLDQEHSSEPIEMHLKKVFDEYNYYLEKIKLENIEHKELTALVIASYVPSESILPSMVNFQNMSQIKLEEKLTDRLQNFSSETENKLCGLIDYVKKFI